MELTFKHKYENLSDREIVEKIITEPFDEEAATYLIYDRYAPLLFAICKHTLNSLDRLDELQSELFMHLKGQKRDWSVLRSFQWRSKLSTWLKITAYNLALNLRRELIENNGENTSLDNGWHDDGDDRRTIDIPIDEESRLERRHNTLVLNEAIRMIGNPDQRFVVIRRLQGYSSKEVAAMLKLHWEAEGTIHTNSRGEAVVPDSGYIDNLFKRGYEKAKTIYRTLDR